jgi:hypothetical protein
MVHLIRYIYFYPHHRQDRRIFQDIGCDDTLKLDSLTTTELSDVSCPECLSTFSVEEKEYLTRGELNE